MLRAVVTGMGAITRIGCTTADAVCVALSAPATTSHSAAGPRRPRPGLIRAFMSPTLPRHSEALLLRAMYGALDDLNAFLQEHRRCGFREGDLARDRGSLERS